MTVNVLSIVIPTKNRAVYCFSTIKSILAYSRELQLVVQDSSDGDDLQRMLIGVTDKRLVYRKVSPDLNMTENFDSALKLATGDYVAMIGDDDGICPGIFDAIDICSRRGADSIASRDVYAVYNWPDFRSKYSGDYQAGKLSMKMGFDAAIAEADLSREVDRFLSNAGQGCEGLPKIYHGVVSQNLIQRIRKQHGACFFGVSPDVSFSFLAGVHSRSHLVANFPLTIAGASGNSNAGRSALRTHKGELWADPHMKNYKNEVWPDVIPEFFSVESVWAQATIATVRLESKKYYDKFNFPLLYALMFIRHRDQSVRVKSSVQSCIQEQGLNAVWFKVRIACNIAAVGARILFGTGKAAWARFVKSEATVAAATDIEAASNLARVSLEGRK